MISTRFICAANTTRLHALHFFSLLLFSTQLFATQTAPIGPVVLPPDNALQPAQLGIVINDRDALSAAIGDYYRKVRQIPPQNVVHLQFDPAKTVLEPGEFATLKFRLDQEMPPSVQALALTWAAPYRVGCLSITAAFAFGYDTRYCASGCQLAATSAYFNSSSRTPFSDLQIRPTMMLAARNFAQAKALIDRGIAADRNLDLGAAYLVETSDRARSVRKEFFAPAQLQFGTSLSVHVERTEEIENAGDVMFYFTGAAKLKAIDRNRYLPGAIADHLTSFGGQLTDSSQMSALRWLEAGATGSYGTVVEPCAFVAKFPNPALAMLHYINGETLIEAYWKSVAMPGQGVFIGEPLARPYSSYRVTQARGKWQISGRLSIVGFEYGRWRFQTDRQWFRRIAVRANAGIAGTALPLLSVNVFVAALKKTAAQINSARSNYPRFPHSRRRFLVGAECNRMGLEEVPDFASAIEIAGNAA